MGLDSNAPLSREIAQFLLRYLLAEDESTRGVGMAAIQFGIPFNVFVANVNAGKTDEQGQPLPAHWVAFLNARIVWESGETDEHWEGCYSVGTDVGSRDILVPVPSPRAVRIDGWSLDLMDPNAKWVQLDNVLFEGFIARIIRHECDHCNGVTIMAYVGVPPRVHHVLLSEGPRYRQEHETWPLAADELWRHLTLYTRPR